MSALLGADPITAANCEDPFPVPFDPSSMHCPEKPSWKEVLNMEMFGGPGGSSFSLGPLVSECCGGQSLCEGPGYDLEANMDGCRAWKLCDDTVKGRLDCQSWVMEFDCSTQWDEVCDVDNPFGSNRMTIGDACESDYGFDGCGG